MARMKLTDIYPHLPEYMAANLKRDPRVSKKFICPFCGSGSQRGSSHNGAMSINPDGEHWLCFSCKRSGTIIDMHMARKNLDFNEAVSELEEMYSSAPVVHTVQPRKPEPEKGHDFSAYIAGCHQALKGSHGEAYLRHRGFTEQTMERFSLGYGKDVFGQPCIVIPHDRRGSYFSTRAIGDTDRRHGKPAGIPAILFNSAALYKDEPCYIVESQLCAISIMQEGGSAVALGGTAGTNLLLKVLDEKAPSACLILSLDNDQPGREAQAKLAEDLTGRGIPFIDLPVAGDDCKDPNELLQKNPSALRDNVAAGIVVASAAMEAVRGNELADYENRTASASFADFEAYLKANASRPPIPTGFSSLDKILNGGLTPSLYIMGAISSLGKTSWMLNIADNIASAGHDVLYFSLEMSSFELIAKSISRISFRRIGEQELSESEAFSTFGVLNSANFRLSDDQSSALRAAMDIYRDTIGKHMWIRSGVSNISTDDITQAVEDHIRITGRKPVVFVDYLQILAPEDPHLSDKQNTDRAVVKLKNLSSSHDIPVFCISSLNRSNYSEPINMAAFKESGAIEYGSDVLIGLQLYGIDYVTGEKDTDRKVRVNKIVERAENDPQTEIEVKVLKNRNGCRGGSGCLLFDKKYNSFSEVSEGYQVSKVPTPFDKLPVL